MEFQFGTHWARFSEATGGVIGQLLAMEGVFAFFLESSLLGLFLYGERRLGPRGHWLVAVFLWLGTWLSAFFITATNAWMQHPVGYLRGDDGVFRLTSLAALAHEPLAPVAVPAHAAGLARDRELRDGGPRRLLSDPATAPGARPELRRARCHAGVDRVDRDGLPERGRPGEEPGASPAGRARRDGGPVRDDRGRADGPDRAAGHGAAAPRQPDSGAAGAEPAHVEPLDGRGQGARRVPARGLAGQRAAPLLQLPRHGGAGHALHRHHGAFGFPAAGADGSTRRAPCCGC